MGTYRQTFGWTAEGPGKAGTATAGDAVVTAAGGGEDTAALRCGARAPVYSEGRRRAKAGETVSWGRGGRRSGRSVGIGNRELGGSGGGAVSWTRLRTAAGRQRQLAFGDGGGRRATGRSRAAGGSLGK